MKLGVSGVEKVEPQVVGRHGLVLRDCMNLDGACLPLGRARWLQLSARSCGGERGEREGEWRVVHEAARGGLVAGWPCFRRRGQLARAAQEPKACPAALVAHRHRGTSNCERLQTFSRAHSRDSTAPCRVTLFLAPCPASSRTMSRPPIVRARPAAAGPRVSA